MSFKTEKLVKNSSFFINLLPCSGISHNLIDAVKAYYRLDIVKPVKEMATADIKECASFGKILSKMADIFAMQRGKYNDFGEYEKEYPVFEQAQHIEKAAVHNV